jgi:hypothetical protein
MRLAEIFFQLAAFQTESSLPVESGTHAERVFRQEGKISGENYGINWNSNI